MSSLLSVRELQVRYRRANGLLRRTLGRQPPWLEVVRGVSLELHAGQTTAIVGESGSGKTTLAKALLGLAPVHGGEVRFKGEAVAIDRRGLLQPDRRQLALVFQDPVGSLSPRMSIGQAIAEPLRIHGSATDPAQRAAALLHKVGLDASFANRYPHQLSGGQARRVGIARALALDPALIIADEPTAGLDVSIQGGVLNLLAELQEQTGLGILIITHNLHVVRHVADRVAVMYLGKLIEQGPTEQLFAQPRHPYTQALLSANPVADPSAQARISHTPPTADADLRGVARSAPVGRLEVGKLRLRRPLGPRTAPRHVLGALATERYENCGLVERIALPAEAPSPVNVPSGCEFHPRCRYAQDRCAADRPTARAIDSDAQVCCHYPLD